MESLEAYIVSTRSAVQKLFAAMHSYNELLLTPARPAFTFWGPYNDDVKRQHEEWLERNGSILQERLKRDDEFAAEVFAIATLAGTVLQFAYWAISIYSTNSKAHRHFPEAAQSPKAMKFCIGMEIDEVPAGLVIYAGRNQAFHFDERSYHKLTEKVFDRLASWYSPTFNKQFRDDKFDLSNPNVTSFAANILWKLGWHSYELYEQGLRDLLRESAA